MRHVPSLFALALAAAALATTAGTARAQYLRYGFVSAGLGGTDDAYYDPDFTVAAGFLARFGPPVGVYVGVRTPLVYSRFKPDAAAFVDSVSSGPGTTGTVTGATISMVESGLDLVAGYDTGMLGGYGWYGLHYITENRAEGEIRTSSATRGIAQQNRRDLGPSYGVGLQLTFARRTAAFAEWNRSHGFDDRMLRMEGFRFGLTTSF